MSGVGRRGGWGLGGGEGEDEALAGGILKRGVFSFLFFFRGVCCSASGGCWLAWKGLWSAWVFFDMRALWMESCVSKKNIYGIEGLYKVSHGVRSQY